MQCHALFSEMGSIEIHVSAIRIARYFCIDIGIALATFESIVYRYRFRPILMYRVSVSLNAILEYRAHHWLYFPADNILNKG